MPSLKLATRGNQRAKCSSVPYLGVQCSERLRSRQKFLSGPIISSFSVFLFEELIVSVVTIFEVFKRVLQQRDETAAIQAVALMEQVGSCHSLGQLE